ncbi:MAG: fused MFS/spermidine synthase, partial [Planctomycetota bacterium]|nr:fused MFS/spermidine synthase [Planctomycetota bacterium]
MPHRFRYFLLLACFFLSGLCGLIYQIVWMRMLGLVFGNSTYATATVLAAFMAGLAFGSLIGGRVADRRSDRVKLYGLLEIAIGIYCLVFPFLLQASMPLFAALYQSAEGTSVTLILVRAIVCSLLLLIPTGFMGATLPILLRHFVHSDEGLGKTVGLVYAVNTFGAVAGCVLTGFILIPGLGQKATMSIAVVLNIAIGIVAILLLEESKAVEQEQDLSKDEEPEGEAEAIQFTRG